MPDKLTVFLQEIGTGISKDTVEKFAKSGEPDLPNLPHTKEFIRNVVELGKSFEEEIDIKKLRDSFNSENYKDLTNYEKVLAMKKASVKAELITEKHDSHLLNLVKEVCSEIDYKNNSPRIIVCQSDFPFAGGATKLNGDSIVMLSSAIIDLLDKNELKAVIGHELDHVEDTSKQTFGAVGHYIKGQFTGGRTLREAEFNADSRGAETEGGAAALKSALIKVTKRNQEISDFVHNFTASARFC